MALDDWTEIRSNRLFVNEARLNETREFDSKTDTDKTHEPIYDTAHIISYIAGMGISL